MKHTKQIIYNTLSKEGFVCKCHFLSSNWYCLVYNLKTQKYDVRFTQNRNAFGKFKSPTIDTNEVLSI